LLAKPLKPEALLKTLISLVLSKPGLSLLYGPQGSYKTSISLSLLSRVGGTKVYVATGKHVLLRVPETITLYKSMDILDDLFLPFFLAHEATEKGTPIYVVYDSFIANFAGARGYLYSKVVIKSLVSCLILLREFSRAFSSPVVLVVTEHPTVAKPPLWKVVSRLVGVAVRIEVKEGVVVVSQQDPSLTPLSVWTVSEEELRGVLANP